MEIVAIVIILFFSIVLHEISHGVVAYLNGDPTAKNAGRLTLNPLSHIDLFGTILLPAMLIFMKSGLLFGWAKPVPFDPRNFRDKRVGLFTVGIAGPAMNVILAVIFALIIRMNGSYQSTPFLYYGASINILLAVFNMIPIPPLDGSRAVGVFLPHKVKAAYFSMERWGFFIIIALLYTGVLHRILIPMHHWAFTSLTGLRL